MKGCDDIRALGIDANCCAPCHYSDDDYGDWLMAEPFRGETYYVCCWVSDRIEAAGMTTPEEA